MKQLLLALVACTLLGSAVQAQTPVAHYKFDETAGTTAADFATGGAQASTPGAINGDITMGATGVFGTAYEFKGGYIELQADGSTVSDVNPNSDFTLTLWAKPITGTTIQNTALYTTQNGIASTGKGWVLKTQDAGNVPGWRVFMDQSATHNGFVPSWPQDLDTWQLIWVRYQNGMLHAGSMALGTATITAADLTHTTSSIGAPPILLTTYPVRIGADHAGGNSFKGFMDDVRMYNAPLSDEQLAAIYNEAITGPAAPDIEVSAATLTLANVNVDAGGAPTTAALTITNKGTANLSFQAQGSEANPGLVIKQTGSRFSILSASPATSTPLAPNQSINVVVRFAPAKADYSQPGGNLYGAELEITTNDPDEAKTVVTLGGRAVPVTLSSFDVN